MKQTKRYKKADFQLYENYAVECPNCEKEATVHPSFNKDTSTVNCKNCNYSKKYEEILFYKILVKINCPNCGKQIAYEQSCKEKVSKVNVECNSCEVHFEVKPKIEKYKISLQNYGLKTDPIFGFLLWFQTEIKGKLFWAYNRNHLLEIQSYVESVLRERQKVPYTTMVEKLPQFIKDAKNRDLIVEKINELLTKK